MTDPDLIVTVPDDRRPHLITGQPTDNPEPRIHWTGARVTIWHGDSIEVLSLLPADSFDAVITDPPYALEFMDSEWDTFKSSGTVQARVDEGTDASRPFRDGSTRIRYGRSDMEAFERWCEEWAAQAWRVLKPGGHLLAFGGSRTWHRLTAGIEDAGFELRDSIMWLYATGFPKSLDVSAAIDKKRHDREQVLQVTSWIAAARDAAGLTNGDIDRAFGFAGMAGHWTTDKQQPLVPTADQIPQLLDVFGITLADVPPTIRQLIVDLNGAKGTPGAAWLLRPVTGVYDGPAQASEWRTRYQGGTAKPPAERRDEPTTELARKWRGWGTALAPGYEPIVVARKTMTGTVADNVTRWGTGALNIDDTRTATTDNLNGGAYSLGAADRPDERPVDFRHKEGAAGEFVQPAGRWPKNVVLAHAPIVDPWTFEPIGDACADGCVPGCPVAALEAESGSARFFPAFRYETKAGSDERPAATRTVVDEDGDESEQEYQHPTVKPLPLMRWLVRLVVPRGARILEPFAGSGTTAEAAILEGVECVAVELGAEHLPLIVNRLERQPDVLAERMTAGEHVAPEGKLF